MTDLAVLERARGPQAHELVRLVAEAQKRISARQFETGMRKFRRTFEAKQTAKLEAIFRDLGKHIAKVTAEQGGLVVVQPAKESALTEAPTLGPPTRMEAAKIRAIMKAADLPQWAKDKIGPYLDQLYSGAFAGTYGLSQLSLEPSVRDKAAQAVLKEGGKRLGLIDINASTKDAMFRVLEYARTWESGQPSPMQVARWIRAEVPAGRFVNAGPAYRSQLIARTEIMHATRKSSIETYRKSDVVTAMVAIDGDYDEACAARNGQEYSFDDAEAEMNSDDTHPNCTLMFAPAYVK